MSGSYKLQLNSLFRERYLRNNKRGGLKHLRCFPECLPTGHHASGFCGHRVVVSVVSKSPLPNDVLVVARFSFADNPLPSSAAVDLTQNVSVEKGKVLKNIRRREQPIADLIPATKLKEEVMPESGSVKTVFFMEPPSWHYGWRSSKHTKDVMHRLYVYLLVPKGAKSFVCVADDKSSPFKLSSSKRARDGQEPVNQHLLVTSEESAASIRDAKARSVTKRQRKRRKVGKVKITSTGLAKIPKTTAREEKVQEKMWDNITVPSDSAHEDEFMGLEYPDTTPIDIHPRATADGTVDYDDLKPLQVHQEDILLEFLGWPKSLQDLTQDSKLNEINTDFIDPSLFFG